jgi:hypothetical protein
MSSQPKTVTQQTVQDKAPWGPAQPYFLDLYEKTSQALGETNKNPFTGDFLAQPTATTQEGLQSLTNAARSTGIPTANNSFIDMAGATARGDYLDPNKNPFIKSVVDAASRPVTERFTNTVLPAISDQAIAQGAYGGSRQDVQQNQAADDLARTLSEMSSGMYMQNYMTERENQFKVPSMLGQSFDISTLPGQALLNVGNMQQQQNQAALDNERQKFMEVKQAPWYGLGEAAQILSQGGFSTVTGTQTGPNPNYVDPFTNFMKMALGGASTVASMGSGGGFGWWGR